MVQLDLLRDLARKEWTEYLDQLSGTKVLVWDETLTGPMDLIANYQFFKDREVVKMINLQSQKSGQLDPGIHNIVFITRPIIELMDLISQVVEREINFYANSRRMDKPEYHVLFIPNRSFLCEKRLRDNGVFDAFTFTNELPIHWFPLETDVISLEDSSIYKQFHLDKDDTSLHGIAKALMSFQALYGIIPNVYGKGRAAAQLFEYMDIMRREMTEDFPQTASRFDSVIILDRQIDLISPLLTQLTYEGLIDEFFDIKNSNVKLPEEHFGTVDSESSPPHRELGDTKLISLNSSDELFADLRDRNFNAVGPALSKKAKAVAAQYEERHSASTLQDLKKFVEKMPQMQVMKQSLATHTSIAEMIKEKADKKKFLEALQVEQELINFHNVDKALDYVEEAACRNEDLVKVIRIVCLHSIVSSGLKPKVLESYRKLLLQSYGYQHLLSLSNLEKLGMLSPQESSRNYAILRKRLNLTLDDVNEQNPEDMAYVHSVYAPLSCRLVQYFLQPSWRQIRDVLDLLPGPTIEEIQPLRSKKPEVSQDQPRKLLVLFIGGCTFAEISALRFLSSQDAMNVDITISTTSIINGSSFLTSLLHPIPVPM